MDLQIKNAYSESTTQKQNFNNVYVDKWDLSQQRFIKVQIQIKMTQDNNIMYIYDGRVLRTEQIEDDFKNEEILTNMEKIKHFQWQGEVGQKNKKTGKWIVIWNGNVLQEVGGYYQNGLKEGLWKEPIIKYSNKAQLYEVGEYLNGKKRGNWIYIYNNKKIKGGQYNEYGQRTGKWTYLNDEFHKISQVAYDGEYKNGKKVGQWDIWYKDYNLNKLRQIGCGLYDSTNDGYKNGRWIELSDQFRMDFQIILDGQYKNGKKVGKWNIYRKNYNDIEKIGGGQYDEGGDEIKINQWVELNEELKDDSRVTYKGEYHNGKKIGNWDVLYYGKKIGGGVYDKRGNGCKIGNWIELIKGSNDIPKVTFSGEYQNGIKVGRWDIFNFNNKIGGGLYDESNNGCKIGRWEEFDYISQITCQGNYNNGTKVGRWDIQWKLKSNSQNGGGSYDEGGNGMKNGNWIYLSEDFVDSYRQQKFIEVGEYKFGKKIGRWDIFYRGEELIQSTVFAGGSYDDEGNECKIGKWTELSDQYQDISQITYVGDYKNGKKVGRWDIWYHKNIREKKNDKIQYQRTLIGGGQFDEVGNQCKIGKWTELSYDFSDLYQVSYKGEYKIGKKIGLWETEYKGEQVGGGSYDEEGYVIKIGPWIELHDMFSDNCQIIYKGEYQQGKKVGSWLEMKRKAYQLDFKRGKVIKYDG